MAPQHAINKYFPSILAQLKIYTSTHTLAIHRQMQQFKTRNDGFKEVQKTTLIRLIPFFVLGFAVAIGMNPLNTDSTQMGLDFFPLLIILMVFVFVTIVNIKRQKILFESYTLTFGDTSISREQHNTPTLTIPHSDLKEITKNSNGSFLLKGNSASQVIGIPAQIEDYDHVEKLLTEFQPISTKSNESRMRMYSVLLTVLMLGSMYGVYNSDDKRIVGISGSIILALLGCGLFEIQTNKNVDYRVKKISWFTLLVAASVIGMMYFKLSA